MALFSAGSSLTYHLAPSVLNVITTARPFTLPLVVFLKLCSRLSTLYSSSCTLHLSVLLSLPFPLTATFMQMTISSSSLSTHSNFDSSISYLQNAPQQISSWTTANLLTLNSCKTEFLLIDLKNQLAKIQNSSLDTSHSARNLVVKVPKSYHITPIRCSLLWRSITERIEYKLLSRSAVTDLPGPV